MYRKIKIEFNIKPLLCDKIQFLILRMLTVVLIIGTVVFIHENKVDKTI